MNHLDPQTRSDIERSLGSDAITALAGHDLLRTVVIPASRSIDPATVASRTNGAVIGLALGDALVEWSRRNKRQRLSAPAQIGRWLFDVPDHGSVERVTAATQLFVQSAEAWLRDGWGAPESMADELVSRGPGLRAPGHAVRRTMRELQAGQRWFEAAPRSFGDAALPRSVATGLVSVGDPARAGTRGSLDAAVTHRSRGAALCSATLSGLIAGLVVRPAGSEWRTVARQVVGSVDHSPTHDLLLRAVEPGDVPPVGQWQGDVRPHADQMLTIAIWAQHAADPAEVLFRALTASEGNRTAVAVAAALWGAIHGVEALPPRVGCVEGRDGLEVLARRLAEHVTSGDVDAGPTPGGNSASEVGADIWFLVDRSGSMASIADDVVRGFDRFFAEQRAVAGEATVTVVQFDGEDPHDVIVDAQPIHRVPSIRDRFQPRGMTPLYDAIGLLLDRAEARRGVDEDQLVVVFTDGMENESRRYTQEQIFERISALRERGWTFVFLGANQDSYGTGAGLAMPAGNVSNFDADSAGVASSYDGLSRTVREYRAKPRAARRRDQDDFWGGVKEAEQR